MTYHSIKQQDKTHNLNITLTMEEIKILHNACVDIIHEYPEMIGYDRVREELETIIIYNQSKLN